MAFRYLSILTLVTALGAACASAPINKKAAVELANADKLVADGCYDCLTQALAIYERLAVGQARPLIVQRIFETDVLIGLRLKELAMRPVERFDAAQRVVPELPATFPAAKYLEIAESVPFDPGGGMPKKNTSDSMMAFNPARARAYKDALAAGPSATLGAYLAASLDCTLGARIMATPASSTASATPQPPTELVKYRLENCTPIARELLIKRVTSDPRFTEAGVIVGRVRSTRPGAKEVADARVWLDAAIAKWPRSSSVTYALGHLNQTVGDCRAAVAWYDKTLAEFGEHEDAHLGRLMCLSYLRRHAEALEEAGGMIFRKITVGEAYYWRAWNYRELNNLPAARQDSDKMKSLLFNDLILTLAGQIEYDQTDLPVAEKDLTEAVRLARGDNCIAQWYWSLVQLKKEAWPQTAEGFVQSMNCYEGDKAKNVGYLGDMKKAENVDESYRKGQIANFEEEIRNDDSQISASAFNAAVNFARAQNREKALQYLELAARDPARADQVAELRKLIVK